MSEAERTSATRMRVEGRELVFERRFDAPRDLVWKAWTEPERLMQWWGPRGWTLTFCEVDLRPGGVWSYGMRGPDGEESWGKAVYREVASPARLVYMDSFTDANGAPMEGMPMMEIEVEFAEDNGGTVVTSRARFASEADLQAVLEMGMEEGLAETWDRLAEHLAASMEAA